MLRLCLAAVLAAGVLGRPDAGAGAAPRRGERCAACGHAQSAPLALAPTEVHSQASFEGCSSERGCAGIKLKDGRVVERYGDADAFRAAASAGDAPGFTFLAGDDVLSGGVPRAGPFWWMKENSPFRDAYETFRRSSLSSSAGAPHDLSGLINGAQSFDISRNPFLNGELRAGPAPAPAPAKYVGSSPSPFAASTAYNRIETSEFEQELQQQQSLDDGFGGAAGGGAGGAGGAARPGHGDLQQTCAGQGYVCVHKAQCNNGVVNTNGAGVLQANTKKQYCNTKTEICCRIEIANIPGAGVDLQGVLGVGSATFGGSGADAGSGIFGTAAEAGGGSFQSTAGGAGASFQGANGGTYQSGSNGGSFESSSSSGTFEASFGSSGAGGQGQQGFAASGSNRGFGSTASGSNFGATASGSNFGATTASGSNFGATASGSNFGASGQNFGSTASGQNSGASGQNSGASGQNFGASGQNFGSTAFGQNSGASSDRTNFQSTNSFSSSSFGSNGQGGQGQGGQGFGSSGAGFSGAGSSYNFQETTSTVNRYNGGGGGGTVNIPASSGVYKGATDTQTNLIESDSFSSGSSATGVYRPGQAPSKPGLPYLPPVLDVAAGSDVSSTASYVPPPPPPAPTAPAYLPPEINPQGNPSDNRPSFLPGPTREPDDSEGSLLLDQTRTTARPRRPVQPVVSDTPAPAGCAAALKCTPIEFCTFEGVISNTSVRLSKEQEDFRVPLTDCKDIASGTVGKCCRDPTYTDPWPTNQLGKWVPGVFGGDDGAYKPDNRGQPNSPAPSRVRTTRPPPAAPPVTGGLLLTNYRTTEKPGFPYPAPAPERLAPAVARPPAPGVKGATGQAVSQGFGQTITQGQGQYSQGGRGQFGQGQAVSRGQGVAIGQGQGQTLGQGQGAFVSKGQGQIVSQGQGQIVSQGQGQIVSQGQGAFVSQGQGAFVSQGQGAAGQAENAYSESRVFLQQYNAGSQCGLEKGQKPYGNRNDLEVDFAEIPWQAMILLQTNRSLLCGGVITRPDVVLTSAACVDGLQAQQVMIKGGEWKLGIDEEPLPFQIVQVKNILRHPGYRSGSLHNDVAILVLAEKLRLAQNIYPICLPSAADTLDGFYNGAGECIVTGWGRQVLQVNIPGAIMHSVNISLLNPGECESKISQDYPHLLEQYDQTSCACGQPTNPINNVCKVDTGSALACTTGDGHFVLRGIYSWDSGCQAGNQLAAFYKFDVTWYEWALGLSEAFGQTLQSSRQSQFSSTEGGFGGFGSGVKGGGFSKFSQSSQASFGSQAPAVEYQQAPGAAFGASYSAQENSFYRGRPQIVTYTSKPEIVTFTTKPEYFTYTTKPKIVTYTTKPQLVTYETSGSGINPQFVAPGVTFNPGFEEVAGARAHALAHGAQCQCAEGK